MLCFEILLPVLLTLSLRAAASDLLPGFDRSPFFNEQVRLEHTDTLVRILTSAPQTVESRRPTLVVFYATPNGNTIEQTMGCATVPDLDWHYDIQHIAAQTRRLREVDRRENVVLVCLQPDNRSWPAWMAEHSDGPAIVRALIERKMKEFPGRSRRAVITGHSGGGSMIFAFINAYARIPAWVSRIAFLDANYSYSDDAKHGDKLLAWLKGDAARRLVVIAYDDREITLDGKKVVSPAGGTYRATDRMLDRFGKDSSVAYTTMADFDCYCGRGGQISIFAHRNPKNKILHTALVGEMNGYLYALTLGTPEVDRWGAFGGPRAYAKWIEPCPVSLVKILARSAGARGGTAVMEGVSQSALSERESAVLAELTAGNLPEFLRAFVPVRLTWTDAKSKAHAGVFYAMPDYLAVGSNADFVRTPLTPMTAQAVADAFGCILPTRKMVDDIYRAAEVKLEPRPLTENREAVATFIQHNSIIESQRAGKRLGALVAGIKKDVVVTSELAARPNHVAIYGWHKLDGTSIQPLTTVHIANYVDYSHGVRLVKRWMLVDGEPREVREVLADAALCGLLSDEGPIPNPRYPPIPQSRKHEKEENTRE